MELTNAGEHLSVSVDQMTAPPLVVKDKDGTTLFQVGGPPSAGTIAALAQSLRDREYAACSGPREAAHQSGECYSQLNTRQPIFALLGYEDIRNLEGKLLTVVDASFQDREQRRAVKSLVRRAIWFEWVKYLDTDDVHVGMPNL